MESVRVRGKLLGSGDSGCFEEGSFELSVDLVGAAGVAGKPKATKGVGEFFGRG